MPATLLLADDSVTIQRVIELTFASEDVRVISASDGEAALRRLDAEPPDVVLADVGIPKRDGYDLAAYIKRSPALRHIPVLLLTGAFEPIDEDRARASGCDGILVKPFEPQQLVDRVKELLAGERPRALWPEDLPRVELPSPRAVPPAPSAAVAPPPMAASGPHEPAPAPPIQTAPAPWTAERKPAEPGHADWQFQQEIEQLDAAFAEIDADSVGGMDQETASDFARDLRLFRSRSEPATGKGAFGDWDLPDPVAQPETPAAASPEPAPPPALEPALAPTVFHEPAPPRVFEASSPAPVASSKPAPVEETGPAGSSKVSLADAFAALLAAEQSHPVHAPRPAPPGLSEAAVEEIVRRVLARMTDQTVREVVHDTAERLITEEIAKIRTKQ